MINLLSRNKRKRRKKAIWLWACTNCQTLYKVESKSIERETVECELCNRVDNVNFVKIKGNENKVLDFSLADYIQYK